MNRWLKRCTSLLVLVVMICGMMPTAAFSAETEHTHTYENGICTGCGAAQPGPRITAQPADASADRLD